MAFNMHLLIMSSEEVYELARETAEANQQGRRLEEVMPYLSTKIGESCVSFDALRSEPIRSQMGEVAFAKLSSHLIRLARLTSNPGSFNIVAGEEVE